MSAATVTHSCHLLGRRRTAAILARLILLGALAFPIVTSAQSAVHVEPGARVRIHTVDGVTHVGRLAGTRSDSLLLHPERDEARVIAVPQAGSVLDVSGGRPSRWRAGAAVGAAVGAALGASLTDTFCFAKQCNSSTGERASAGAAGAVVGVAVGGLIGLAVRTENWHPATVAADSRVKIEVAGDGIGVRVGF